MIKTYQTYDILLFMKLLNEVTFEVIRKFFEPENTEM